MQATINSFGHQVPRCLATAKSGKQCGQPTMANKQYCHNHKNLPPFVRVFEREGYQIKKIASERWLAIVSEWVNAEVCMR